MKNSIDENIKTLANHLFREHYGKMVSYLSQKYGYQALISSIHCTSESYKNTDWKTIAYLYRQLERIEPYLISVKLNKIIAESNFRNLLDLIPELILMEKFIAKETEFTYFSVKGHFYAKLKEWNLAIENYKLALNCTRNKTNINFINRKIELTRKTSCNKHIGNRASGRL